MAHGQLLSPFTASGLRHIAHYEGIVTRLLNESRAARGDGFATASEMEGLLSDPLAHLELVDERFIVETGRVIKRGMDGRVRAFIADEMELAHAQDYVAREDAYRAECADREATESFAAQVAALEARFATEGGDFAVEHFANGGVWKDAGPRFATVEAAQGWAEEAFKGTFGLGLQRVVRVGGGPVTPYYHKGAIVFPPAPAAERDDFDLTTTIVAQLIGFDLVRTFAELPVGFRVKWRSAASAGHFQDCKTYWDFKVAYCRYLLDQTASRETAAA